MVKDLMFNEQLLNLIKEELNVKEVEFSFDTNVGEVIYNTETKIIKVIKNGNVILEKKL
jgi:hypothetical protein